MGYTVRIEHKDIEMLERKEDEKYWNNIIKNYSHELPEIEMENKWNKLQKEKRRKVFEEFSPEKVARESDNIDYKTDEEEFTNEKETDKNKEKNKKRKERTPEGKEA